MMENQMPLESVPVAQPAAQVAPVTGEAMPQATVDHIGFLDTLKEKLNPSALMEKVQDSKGLLIEAGLYAGFGFLTGFLFKKFSSYVALVVALGIGIILLNQYGIMVVTVNWAKLYGMFGMTLAAQTGPGMAAGLWQWIQAHLIVTASFVFGFLLGIRLG